MSEWKETTFGEIVTFQRGHDLTQTNFSEGKYIVAGSNGPIGYHNEFTTKGPGLTIGRSGNSIGVAHYYENDFWAHNTTLYSKEFHNSHPKFVFYLLKTFNFSFLDGGSAVPTLNRNHVHTIELKVPDYDEQQSIAAILSSLDNKIDLLRRQNQTLEQLAQTIFKQWFVTEGKEEWNTAKLSDYAFINQRSIDKNYSFQKIEYLDTGSITKGIIEGFQTFNLEDAPSRAQRLVQKNDIVYSLVRPIQKHYGILKTVEPNTVVSTGFAVITCNGIDPHFIYILLTQDRQTEYFETVANNSTSTYPCLKPSDIANLEFKMPPKDLLKKFSDFASPTWDKISINQKEIQTLTQLRDSLLPRLMSGRLRVG